MSHDLVIIPVQPRGDLMERYSLSMRLQRVTTEYAYVLVPVTDDITVEQEDGTGRIDPDKLVQQTMELASERGVTWYQESLDVHLHPLQKAPEPEELSFRPDWW